MNKWGFTHTYKDKKKDFELSYQSGGYSQEHWGENNFQFIQATQKSCKQIRGPPTCHNACGVEHKKANLFWESICRQLF